METLSKQPPAETLATDIAPPGATVPESQPQLGDSRLAAILSKRESGETLTAADRGYLGSVKRKSKPKKMATAPAENILLANDNSSPSAFNPANQPESENLLLNGKAPDQGQASEFVFSAGDTADIQACAAAIIDSVDTFTQDYIEREAKSAGADARSIAEFRAAVAIAPRNRDLMLKGSDPLVLAVCKMFKCPASNLVEKLKSCQFAIGLVCHFAAVRTVVKSIRESQREREAQKTP